MDEGEPTRRVDDKGRVSGEPSQPQGGTPTTPVPPPPYPQHTPPPGSYGYPQQGQGYPPQQSGPYAQGGYPPPGYPYPYPYQQTPVKKGLPRWFWIVMGIIGVFSVLALIAVIALGSWLGTTVGKPLLSVTEFYTALDRGDCAEARELVTGEAAEIDYCARWNALKERGTTTVGDPTGSFDIRNGLATVKWQLQAGGRSHRVDVQLEEIGGRWKIVRSFPDLLPNP